MRNNIVHGDFEIKLTEEYDYKGSHIEIFSPEYNEIQQKERDSYIMAGLSRLLNDHNNNDTNKNTE